MPRQLSFDLPVRPALGRDDFFISPANEMAVATIEATASWPSAKLALSGPAGSGKTHLALFWAAQDGAQIVQAAALDDLDVPVLAQGPVAVEDVPAIATDDSAQQTLFHLHNLIRAEGHALLLTGRGAPRNWGLTLPDLHSRVAGAHHVALDPPDDVLLSAVLAKLFADRQITPRPDVIPYLIQRMDRSFEAAATLVDRLDRMALSEGRTMSRSLAARLIADPGANG